MYLIDKPLYAIELTDGSLAIDNWTSQEVYITFCRKSAEREVRHHIGGKIVLYSDYIKEKNHEFRSEVQICAGE